MSGTVPPFLIRQADYITFHIEENCDIRMTARYIALGLIHSLVFSLRAQPCDRYGSGTLHPGQIIGGSLPLLSPLSPPGACTSATTREILAAKGGTVGEKLSSNFA